MVQYTTTDQGWYEEIALTEYGEATQFVAAEFVTGDYRNPYVLEPRARTYSDGGWNPELEERFREDVRALVPEFEDTPEYIVFDPACDDQSEEKIEAGEDGRSL